MPYIRIKKRFDAIAFASHGDANLADALPCRPSLDKVFTNLHCGNGGLPVLAQDRNRLPQDTSVALAIYQRFRGRDPLKRVSPDQHSAIGGEIVRRDLDSCCKIVNRSPAVPHPMQCFGPQHVTTAVRQRTNPATPIRQAVGNRQVTVFQGFDAQRFQRLMVWLVEVPESMQCHG